MAKYDMQLGNKGIIDDINSSSDSTYSSEKIEYNYYNKTQVDTAILNKADNVPIVTSTASTYSTALDADKFYNLGELTSFYLNLASTSGSNLHEYMFQFKSGTTPTIFTYDSENITLVNADFAPVANKTYQGSVVNGICIIVGV